MGLSGPLIWDPWAQQVSMATGTVVDAQNKKALEEKGQLQTKAQRVADMIEEQLEAF